MLLMKNEEFYQALNFRENFLLFFVEIGAFSYYFHDFHDFHNFHDFHDFALKYMSFFRKKTKKSQN